jgi:hypothetical protein
MREQIYKKVNKKYIPITPIDGWDDDNVFKETGVYLVDVDVTKSMEECVLKLYNNIELEREFDGVQLVTKEKLQEIIQTFINDKIGEKTIFGYKCETIILPESVEYIVDKLFDLINNKNLNEENNKSF